MTWLSSMDPARKPKVPYKYFQCVWKHLMHLLAIMKGEQ